MQLRSRSVDDEPTFVVGMDAHAHKLAVSIWDWSDRLNACLHREIKCVDVDAMVKTYERHVDLDSITVIEASTNSEILKRRLENAGYRAEVVLSKPEMLRLMQLQGVNYKGAFAMGSAVEDVRRFPEASKLAAYCGFASVLGTSGDAEESAKRRGGTGRPLDGEGRRDVKHFFTEAGQAVLTCCAGSKLGRKGWAMINRGKPRNKVVCAIGHKLVLYAFHVMRGDPTPNRDGEEFFKRKMRAFYQKIGARRMHELGHGTKEQFASAQAKLVYGSLPEPAASGGAAPQGTKQN